MNEKIGYIFPGQGAQEVGMGQDVYQSHAAAREVFILASELTGMDLAKLCFEGPIEKLSATDVSQVAILTTSVALLNVGRETGKLEPEKISAAGGLSLGEYTALCMAGALDLADGIRLVQKRGRHMQEASEANPGTMIVLRGSDKDTVEKLCRQVRGDDVLWPANYNCPGQIVVSGTKSACDRLSELADEEQIPVIQLRVAGAFHSKLMSSAGTHLAEALAQTEFRQPRIPVVANVTGKYYTSAQEIRESLARQVDSPIRWQRCMETMIADGIDRFYEIGPGKVLAGLARRISRAVKVTGISGQASFEKA